MIKQITLGVILLLGIIACSNDKYNEAYLSNFKDEIKTIKRSKEKKGYFPGDSIPTIIGVMDKSLYKGSEVVLFEVDDFGGLEQLQNAVVNDGFFYFPDSIKRWGNIYDRSGNGENEPLHLAIEIRDPNNFKILDFFLEKDKKVELFSGVEQFRPIGGKFNTKKNEMDQKLEKYFLKIKKIQDKYGATSNEQEKKKLYDQIEKILKKRNSDMVSYLKQNMDNKLGQTSIFTWMGILEPQELYELIELIPDGNYKNSYPYERLNELAENMRNSEVGNNYTNLEGVDVNGDENSLEKYVKNNKLTLIDFWDTACGSCIDTAIELKKIYNEYHDKGFEIVGVSTENDNQFWKNSINQNELPWPQIYGDNQLSNIIFKNYSLMSTPFLVLVNQEGKIVARGVSIEELEKILQQNLK